MITYGPKIAYLGNLIIKIFVMNKLFRGLIAGYGAKKLGGGCLGTVVVFFIIYWLLGNVNC